MALGYVAVLVPIRTGFAIQVKLMTAEWWVELVVDAYFVADIFLNFRTAFYQEGALVRDTKKIARSYAKGWLAIDVVSCLPVGYVTLLIENSGGGTLNTKVFKILRLLRLAKLLR